MDHRARELERIHAAYRERDAAGPPGRSPWLDPGYRLQIQELEWALLQELARAGIELTRARALEVGCGSGYFLGRLLDYGVSRAAGIDLMDERIARARERHPRLELVVGDASRLPWPDESFDLVTQFTCLSSVLDPELRRRIASEMWRVLAPGGVVVSYDARPTPWPIRALRALAGLRAGGDRAPQGTPTAPVETAELRGWFAAAEVRCRSVGLDADLGRVLGRFRLAGRMAAGIPALRVHTLAVARRAPLADPHR